MWPTRPGPPARAYSSKKITCCSMEAPRPPYSVGQPTQVQPPAARCCSQRLRSAGNICSSPGPPRNFSWANSPVRLSRSQPAISSRKASSAALKVSFMLVSSIQQQAGNQLALRIAVAQVEFAGLGPFEIQVHVIFPGKTHAAMQLDGAAGVEEQGVGAVPLGHGGRFRQLGGQLTVALGINGFLG